MNQKSDPNLGFVFIGSNDEKNKKQEIIIITNHKSKSKVVLCFFVGQT